MSQLHTGHMRFGSGPQGSLFIFGQHLTFPYTATSVDTKPGMCLVPSTGTYTDGCERADTSGDETKVCGIKEIPTLPDTEPTGDPRDHVDTIGDQGVGLPWIPGNAYWFRCKDGTTSITFMFPCIPDTTNCGLKGQVDAAVIDSGSTAVTSTAANGQIVTGVNVKNKVAYALKARSASGTESWLPAVCA